MPVFTNLTVTQYIVYGITFTDFYPNQTKCIKQGKITRTPPCKVCLSPRPFSEQAHGNVKRVLTKLEENAEKMGKISFAPFSKAKVEAAAAAKAHCFGITATWPTNQ